MKSKRIYLYENLINKEQILNKLDELEMSLDGDNTDDDARGDILEEIAELEEILENFK